MTALPLDSGRPQRLPPSSQEPASRRALAPRAILALAAVLAIALLVPHLAFVPIWDGWAYAECALDVATNRFALVFLRCYGHPAYVYSGMLAMVQLIDVGNPVLLFLVDAGVLATATVGFHRLMRRAFPGEGHRTDIALLTAGFLLQPPFLASVLQPSLDLPVLAGTVWVVALLVERRWFWCAVVGTAMAFSKETGVLLYATLLACWLLWTVVRTLGGLVTRLRALTPAVLLIGPLVAYVGYVIAYRVLRPGVAPVWEGGGGKPLIVELLTPRLDAKVASYFALLFVLNFAWLASATIAADLAVGLGRVVGATRSRAARSRAARGRDRAPRVMTGADPTVAGFLSLATVMIVVALTRFITFSNIRYLMAGTALLLAVAYVALVRLGAGPRARRAALSAYAVLLAVSAVRTVDPMSRWLWGTFEFGTHRMLDMTSITGECCGSGRDQLVYSLEFTRFHDLTDSVVTSLLRDTTTAIAFPSRMAYHAVGRLDPATRHRTLRRAGGFEPTVTPGPLILTAEDPPRSVLYVAVPNAKDAMTLALLANLYTVGPPRRFESGGYALSAYHLTRRSERAAP